MGGEVEEFLALAASTSVEGLAQRARALREEYLGLEFDTCSIMNARSGRCGEDCKWCAQSSHHRARCEVYPLVGVGEAVGAAEYNVSRGVRRFSLVTSGRGMSSREVESAAVLYRAVAERVPGLYLCASMGLLDRERLQVLYDAGVRRYHCNLETAPSFFPQLCSTHGVEDKVRVLRDARAVGMDVCSGGIIGMGETRAHRVELALALRELGVMSIPLNILNPIPGTPLEGMEPLPDDEVVLTAAMFRIINPRAHIRLAGGRTSIDHLLVRLLHAGVSAAIVGDMLTTTGSDIASDFATVTREGFEL